MSKLRTVYKLLMCDKLADFLGMVHQNASNALARLKTLCGRKDIGSLNQSKHLHLAGKQQANGYL
jgi:hypothetical protein